MTCWINTDDDRALYRYLIEVEGLAEFLADEHGYLIRNGQRADPRPAEQTARDLVASIEVAPSGPSASEFVADLARPVVAEVG